MGHRVLGKKYGFGKEAASVPEDKTEPAVPGLRTKILRIAEGELGVKEATGNNDGQRVEEYLRYTGLGKGYAWCAAFVSWCYGQAGLAEPRNPWSPSLFPNTRTYGKPPDIQKAEVRRKIRKADLFGVYGAAVKRIHHVGLIKRVESTYLLTVEGNSNNRVESRRRHLKTVYALSDWAEN